MSDTTAVAIGATAYLVGGYTTTAPLRSVLAFRSRAGLRARSQHSRTRCARAPPPRSAQDLLIAGGTDGTRSAR